MYESILLKHTPPTATPKIPVQVTNIFPKIFANSAGLKKTIVGPFSGPSSFIVYVNPVHLNYGAHVLPSNSKFWF